MNLMNRLAGMSLWVVLFTFLAGMVSLVSPEPQADATNCNLDEGLCYCNDVAAVLRDSVEQDILTVEEAKKISESCYTENL